MKYQGIEQAISSASNSLWTVFGEQTNTKIFVTNYSGTLIQDAQGNYSLDTTAQVTINATLWQAKDPYFDARSGTDLIRTYMEGYLVSPNKIDGTFTNYLNCEITQNNVTTKGKFSFIDNLPSALHENFSLTAVTGQKICGYFERQDGNV